MLLLEGAHGREDGVEMLSSSICPSCGYYGSGNKKKSILRTIEQDVIDDDD